jgi:ribosomal protein L37AE/L43A
VSENERSGVDQKQGVINKCPNCGGPLKAFVSRCELCGHELAGVSASNSVTELVNRFAEIEASLVAAGLQGSKLENELVARRARVIRDFPIPLSREDLQSLIYFIHPKIQENIKPDPNAEDWRVKFKEVITLAKTAYKGDAKARAEFEEIERSLNVSLSGVLQTRARRSPLLALGVGLVALLVVAGLVSTQWDSWKVKQCEDKYAQGAVAEKARLDAIVAAATAKLQDKAYGQARTTLRDVHWDYQEAACKSDAVLQEKAVWDAKREDLLAQVAQAEESVVAAQREQANREEEAKRAEAERETQEKQAVAARAEQRRISAAENDLAEKARQGAARRRANSND